MKKIILGTTLFIALILVFGCKKDNTFKVVTDKVYTINEITRGGCFDYNPNPADTTAILPIPVFGSSMNIVNGFVIVRHTSSDFPCLANDSIDLKGNVLSIFIKSTDDENTDCNCNYTWEIKLDIIENKGLKLMYFEYENDGYVLKLEEHNNLL